MLHGYLILTAAVAQCTKALQRAKKNSLRCARNKAMTFPTDMAPTNKGSPSKWG